MLRDVDSRELTRWQVYERLTGPLDNSYRDGQLASINELIQNNTYLTGAVSQSKKNPAPKPKQVPRPWELHKGQKPPSKATFGGEVVLEEGEVNPFAWL